jgi:hydroxymethylpyrimidine/phosphomethylpyrimidine kinase
MAQRVSHSIHYIPNSLQQSDNQASYTYPTVLTIAGFDGSGGAGIQADMKTIHALGCYATSVLTALPVQNTTGVKSVFPIPPEVVEAQLMAVLDDIRPDAIKIGMVHTAALVEVIVRVLKSYPDIPIVFDPVMVSSSGHRLLDDVTIQVITEQLLPIPSIVTPNLDEAEVLTQMPIKHVNDMLEAGRKIKAMGCPAVLMKGGHLNTAQLTSFFFAQDGTISEYHSDKLETNNTHGTGCTLSSAIASYLAQGKSSKHAVLLGQKYVHLAIANGMDVKTGNGKGPLNHLFDPLRLIKRELI